MDGNLIGKMTLLRLEPEMHKYKMMDGELFGKDANMLYSSYSLSN